MIIFLVSTFMFYNVARISLFFDMSIVWTNPNAIFTRSKYILRDYCGKNLKIFEKVRSTSASRTMQLFERP